MKSTLPWLLAFCLALTLLVAAPAVRAGVTRTEADAPAAEKTAGKKKAKKAKEKKAKASSGAEAAQETAKEPASETAKDEAARAGDAEEAKVEDKAAEEKAPAEPKTHEVKAGPLKVEVSLEGVFAAKNTTPVALDASEWSKFEVVRAVPHGARVKRGEPLVTLDMEDIDRTIEDLRREIKLADFNLRSAELALEATEKTAPLEMAEGVRLKQQGDEDLKLFLQIDRPLDERSADFSLKSAENYLAYSEEELKQLQKMYEADDLTEETEEIVLRRARDDVERVKFSLDRARIGRDRTKDISLPRQELALRQAVAEADIALKKFQATQPIDLETARLNLAQQRIGRERSQQRLERLLADRKAMELKAPAAGVVYYGEAEHGKWGDVSAMAEKLRRGGSLSDNQVVVTIVSPRPMEVVATVPEKELHQVKPGVKGKAVPTGYPEMKLEAIVADVDAVPFGPGEFRAKLTVADRAEADVVVPGMNCSVKLTAYEKQDALTVPASALETDELKDDVTYVYLVDAQGESKKQQVTVGKRAADKVEILKGLKAGDKVLVEPPKEE